MVVTDHSCHLKRIGAEDAGVLYQTEQNAVWDIKEEPNSIISRRKSLILASFRPMIASFRGFNPHVAGTS